MFDGSYGVVQSIVHPSEKIVYVVTRWGAVNVVDFSGYYSKNSS